jgi:hypothetical protein
MTEVGVQHDEQAQVHDDIERFRTFWRKTSALDPATGKGPYIRPGIIID